MTSWLKIFSAVLLAALVSLGTYIGYQRSRDRQQQAVTEWKHGAASATQRLFDYPTNEDYYSIAKSMLDRAPKGADTYALKQAVTLYEMRQMDAKPEWDSRANQVVQKLDSLLKELEGGKYTDGVRLQNEIEDAMQEARDVIRNKGTASGSVSVEVAYARLVRAMNPY